MTTKVRCCRGAPAPAGRLGFHRPRHAGKGRFAGAVALRAASAADLSAVVVGGGPSGLAAAMMLAQEGYGKVDVIEKRESPSYFEPDKAFVFSIDERGQKFIDLVGAMDLLKANGVGTREDYHISRLYPDGRVERKQLAGVIKSDRTENFWIPRVDFIRLLYECVEAKFGGRIKVHFASECERIEKVVSSGGGAERLRVVAVKEEGEAQERLEFSPSLLLGCDGLKSSVRQALVEWDNASDGPEKTEGESLFEMRKFPSLSAGLRYKVLTLPSSFRLSKTGAEKSISKEVYVLIGAMNTFRERLRLGLLPIADASAPRTANFITAAEDHVLWSIKDGEGMLDYLERALPQLPIREIVGVEEAERFAASEGARFPKPQYCEKFVAVLEGGECGVALLGDALHAFPPDLGQGVNAGLEDIMELRTHLRASGEGNYAQALPSFQEARLPDVRALIRLMQVGFPLQYNQHKVLKLLWTVKFSLQMLVAKVLPRVFYGPPFLGVQDASLQYRDLLARMETNARRYQIGACLVGAMGAVWMSLKHKNVVGALVSLLAPPVLIKLAYKPTPKQLRLDGAT